MKLAVTTSIAFSGPAGMMAVATEERVDEMKNESRSPNSS